MFFIIVGSGLMKPNISNIVGKLYPENDVRLDAGFVIFYMSVNMGGLISPLILNHFVGYHTNPNAIPIAAIKNPPWKLPVPTKWFKINGEINPPILTDI